MKKLPLSAGIAILLAGFGWWIHAYMTRPAPAQPALAAQTQASIIRTAPNSPVVTQIIPREIVTTPSSNLWREYAMARQKALQQSPELAAEFKELQAEMGTQMHKLEAAIIRADPKTAPIIAKYHAMREQQMTMMDSPARKPATSPGNLTKCRGFSFPGPRSKSGWYRLVANGTSFACRSPAYGFQNCLSLLY